MRNLHDLPRFSDRWGWIYLEHGRLDKDQNGILFQDLIGTSQLPINQLALIMLGPGTTVTHAAVRTLAENATMLVWGGEQGVRTYAHLNGGTFSSRRLMHQAQMACLPEKRLQVAYKMYTKRFPGINMAGKDIEQVRGMEGLRVRSIYSALAKEFGIEWDGRSYDQNNWAQTSAINRAVSVANSCLYGICHSAIVAAGYSPALGFIHVGKMLSFVYDIADLYKMETSVRAGFLSVSRKELDLERSVRIACREEFHRAKLMGRIVSDIAEVLDVGDDIRETPGEFEGKADTVVDGGPTWGFSGQSIEKSS